MHGRFRFQIRNAVAIGMIAASCGACDMLVSHDERAMQFRKSADTAILSHDWAAAEQYLHSAVDESRHTDSYLMLPDNLRALAKAQMELNKNAEAEASLREACSLYAKLAARAANHDTELQSISNDVNDGYAESLWELGEVEVRENKLADAARTYKIAIDAVNRARPPLNFSLHARDRYREIMAKLREKNQAADAK
jgi:DNA repair ATPase RecN